MAAPSLLRQPLGFELPWHLLASWAFSLVVATLAPMWRCDARQAVLEYLLSSGWAYTRAFTGKESATHEVSISISLSAQLWEQVSIHALMSGLQPSNSPPVSLTGPPTSQGGSSSLCCTPGLRHPICGLNHSPCREGLCPCNLPFPLSPLPGSQVPTWLLVFPSYPFLCESFLQPWLYRSLSDSFQLVFSENFSTCRCIFEVFIGGVEFHVLLLHLSSSPHTHIL